MLALPLFFFCLFCFLQGKSKAKGPPRLVDRADSFLAKHVAAGSPRFVLALNFLMPWGSFVAYLAPRDTPAGSSAAGSPTGGDPRVKLWSFYTA